MADPLVLKTDDGDDLTIEVLARMHRGSRDYWDGNWMISPITLRIGGFAGRIEAGLRMNELIDLREGLEQVLKRREGTAELKSLEEWLSLRVSFEPKLGLTARGEAVAHHATGTKLVFRLERLNQSDLRVWIDQLRAIEEEFPLRDGEDVAPPPCRRRVRMVNHGLAGAPRRGSG
jgi:hypothetical protein